MSVADQINRIKTNIANAYSAAEAKGATIPEVKNSENLSACVDSITTGGGGGGTQFGLTAEQMLGTPDGEGNLTIPTLPSITFSGLKSISGNAFYCKFYARKFETGAIVSFPDLTTVDASGLYDCFNSCPSLTTVDLSALTTVDSTGLNRCFNSCTSLTTVDLSALTTVDTSGLGSCFYNCPSLTTVDLSALTTVGSDCLNYCFYSCTSLTSVSFPSLTSVQTDSFGSASYNYCFNNCTALTEIHFRADMQATIEAMTGYADKWGATNATIYFDL